MSRANIVSMGWASRSEFVVVFKARDGERTYSYDPASGTAIMGGADPHDFPGEEVGALNIAEQLGKDLEEIGEIVELAAL